MVGRQKEIEELNDLCCSGESELIAIYGRRRVGKTYLVDNVFLNKITFRHAGLAPTIDKKKGVLSSQLKHFYNSLISQGAILDKEPKSWMQAFYLLQQFLQNVDDGSRQVVFIDELPWLDTPRSNFIQAFEGFWNNWACHRKNLMVIVCGSANSWILDNLINNHGGLYNRVTYQINLLPFSLKECEDYYKEKSINFSRYDILQSYMIFGGIPYYMGYMKKKLSFPQNIDDIFFSKSAILNDEFDRLFNSIFDTPEQVKRIVKLLYSKNAGFTRKEIIEKLHISNDGHLSQQLKALINGRFVEKYVPFGFSKRQEHYKLIDPFCLFYLHFLNEKNTKQENFWSLNLEAQPVVVWRGYAFENVCFNHINQIKKALGISGVSTTHSAWSKKGDDIDGMQIDLLINRKDNVINMCEIKFYSDQYVMSETYYRTILGRSSMLLESVHPKYAIQSTLITTYGLKFNMYSGAFIKVITMDDLFA